MSTDGTRREIKFPQEEINGEKMFCYTRKKEDEWRQNQRRIAFVRIIVRPIIDINAGNLFVSFSTCNLLVISSSMLCDHPLFFPIRSSSHHLFISLFRPGYLFCWLPSPFWFVSQRNVITAKGRERKREDVEKQSVFDRGEREKTNIINS